MTMMWIKELARTILMMQSIRMPYGTRLNEYLLLLPLFQFFYVVPRTPLFNRSKAQRVEIHRHHVTLLHSYLPHRIMHLSKYDSSRDNAVNDSKTSLSSR